MVDIKSKMDEPFKVAKFCTFCHDLLGLPTDSRYTLRTILNLAGLSWKKRKKLLAKANPEKRQALIEEFQSLYERMCKNEVVIVSLDEVHIHQDMEVGYSWSPIDEEDWALSSLLGLSKRFNWFGVYNFTDGNYFLWENGSCNSNNCIQFLQHLFEKFKDEARQVVLIWGVASYHRSRTVRSFASHLGFEILSLPAYSPDLNPIKGLWKRMQEDVYSTLLPRFPR